MTMLVHHLLSHSAERAPDAIAAIEPGRTATYRELQHHASRVAAALEAAGVRPGERVVLAMENSIAFIGCYFGIMQAGAVVVPLPPGARSDRLPVALRDCSPAACVVDESTWPAVEALQAELGFAGFVASRRTSPDQACGVLRQPRSSAPETAGAPDGADAESLAAIIYTSGTTGTPRGVMLSHRNITANTASIVQYLELTAADRVMVVLPFYYVYGLSLLHTHVAVGGSVVIDNRFAFPNVVLEAMREHAVTGFAGVPSTFALLLHKSKIAKMSLPSLRYVTQAGGPMPPARVDEWRRVMPGAPLFVMYGATEASARLTYLPPDEWPRRPGSIGRAIPGVEIRVLREDGRPALPGEVGELVARGPNISSGYWRCPEETRERFGPEGYRTGDLGYMDADGFLYLVGRKHDMIKVGAHRVSAKEIEEVLHEHPDVHEAAVVARPDELLGEAPVAHIVRRDGCETTEADIVAFCRARLAEHKVPVAVVFHDVLPKSAAGKIDKRALRENLAQVGAAAAEAVTAENHGAHMRGSDGR